MLLQRSDRKDDRSVFVERGNVRPGEISKKHVAKGRSSLRGIPANILQMILRC
jgi:hypothetical protein